MHSHSRIVKGRLFLTTRNGSTVEEAADNLLKLLKYRERTGMQELKDCKSLPVSYSDNNPSVILSLRH